jgi:ABC-type phosphate/phosphonate transport system substrate-binding protein
MIASLPMYWRAENAAAWNGLWTAVREKVPDLPPLTPPRDLPADWDNHWRAPDLCLSQTCGLPYRARLHDYVTLVGAFDFALPGTPAGHYRSVIVTRPDETRDRAALRLAYNAPDSQSGWAATADQRFAGHLQTGAHRLSAMAVAQGEADIAYLDAVTWRLLERFDRELVAALRVVDVTEPTPGLPLIAAKGQDPKTMQDALAAALDGLTADQRDAMGGPVGLRVLEPQAYRSLPIPAPPPA